MFIQTYSTYKKQKIESLNKSMFTNTWGNRGTGDGQFNFPDGVVVGCNGNLYIADSDNHRIQCFDSNGTFIFKWGKNGERNGEFSDPSGVAVGFNELNESLRNAMLMVPELSSYPWRDFNNMIPSGLLSICISYIRIEYIYVTDRGNNRVQVFDISDSGSGHRYDSYNFNSRDKLNNDNSRDKLNNDNNRDKFNDKSRDESDAKIRDKFNGVKFIRKWGSIGINDGQFNWPWSCAIGYESLNNLSGKTSDLMKNNKVNVIYVSDTYNHRIQVFDSEGNFIRKWGSKGYGDYQFYYPHGICLSSKSEMIYIADMYNHRVVCYHVGGLNQRSTPLSISNSSGLERQITTLVLSITLTQDPKNLCVPEDSFNINNASLTPCDPSEVKFVGQFPLLFHGQPVGVIISENKSKGDILYVVDKNNHCVNKYSMDGNLLKSLGDHGSGDGNFRYPNGIAKGVNRANGTDIMYITDNTHRIVVMNCF